MNEGLDSVLDESGDEDEQESIVNQVLDEIGIDIAGKVSDNDDKHHSDDDDYWYYFIIQMLILMTHDCKFPAVHLIVVKHIETYAPYYYIY